MKTTSLNHIEVTEKLLERFFSRVDKTETCWICKGPTYPKIKNLGLRGYIWIGEKKYQTTRLSYYFRLGKFDESLYVLHKCDVAECINPDHLFLGTQAYNVKDMISKGRKHFKKPEIKCARGHEKVGDNVLFVKERNGTVGKRCKLCKSISNKLRNERLKTK